MAIRIKGLYVERVVGQGFIVHATTIHTTISQWWRKILSFITFGYVSREEPVTIVVPRTVLSGLRPGQTYIIRYNLPEQRIVVGREGKAVQIQNDANHVFLYRGIL